MTITLVEVIKVKTTYVYENVLLEIASNLMVVEYFASIVFIASCRFETCT